MVIKQKGFQDQIEKQENSSSQLAQTVQSEQTSSSDHKLSLLKRFLANKLFLFGGGFIILSVLTLVGISLLSRNNGPVISPTPTPESGQTVVSGDGKIGFVRGADVFMMSLDDAEPQKVGTIPTLKKSPKDVFVAKMAWSSDGRLIGFLLDNKDHSTNFLQVMKIGDGTILDVLGTGAVGLIYDFVWMPDSLEVVVSYADKKLETGQKYYLGKLSVLGFPGDQRFLDWVRPIVSVQISKGGFIYFLDSDHQLWRVAQGGGRFYPVLRAVASFDVSDDGSKIAYERAADGEIWVSNENGGNPKQITFTSEERKQLYDKGGRSHPQWAPDNKRILFTEIGANYKGVGMVNKDGTGLRSVEQDSISPKIIYDEYYQRKIIDTSWITAEQILFIAKTDNPKLTDDLYSLNILDANYQKILDDVSKPVWSPAH